MGTVIRLLGPDLGGQELLVPVDTTSITMGELKERMLLQWPAGMEKPVAAQLRIISKGMEPPNEKTLSELKVMEGETTAMHVVVRSQVPKAAESSAADLEKGSTRCSCIVS
uniref:UBL3-like ubiquitin domain-containing protein n=1 Tax=Haptolina brevifila TaxID=156173 RepID=A0A7S2BVG4_9EUKA